VEKLSGIVARTSTIALVNATLPHIIHLLDSNFSSNYTRTECKFPENYTRNECGFAVVRGSVVNPEIAKSLGLEYKPIEDKIHLVSD
jgi:alanine dehydrogenase